MRQQAVKSVVYSKVACIEGRDMARDSRQQAREWRNIVLFVFVLVEVGNSGVGIAVASDLRDLFFRS